MVTLSEKQSRYTIERNSDWLSVILSFWPLENEYSPALEELSQDKKISLTEDVSISYDPTEYVLIVERDNTVKISFTKRETQLLLILLQAPNVGIRTPQLCQQYVEINGEKYTADQQESTKVNIRSQVKFIRSKLVKVGIEPDAVKKILSTNNGVHYSLNVTSVEVKEGKKPEVVPGLRLNYDAHCLEWQGIKINLSPIRFRLLDLLLRNRGKIVTYQTFFYEIWQITRQLSPEEFDSYRDNIFAQLHHIRLLVQSATQDGVEIQIKNHSGFGYYIE